MMSGMDDSDNSCFTWSRATALRRAGGLPKAVLDDAAVLSRWLTENDVA